MRAPPEAATTMSGLRLQPGAVHGAGDGLAHHGAHRAADEAVLHGAEDNLVGSQPADCVENCVIEAGCFLRGPQPLLVGLHIGKVQRVRGAQTGIHQFIAGFEQQVDALAGGDLEVVPALGADVQVGFELWLVDGLRGIPGT